MKLVSFGAVILPLLAAWVLFSRVGTSRWRKAIAAAADVLAFLSTVLLWNVDSNPLSLFLAALVLGALTFAAVSPEQDIDSLGRLHLGASLSIAAVTTTDLVWSVPAILLFGMIVRHGRERLMGILVSSLAALAGLALVAASGRDELGLILLTAGLSAVWLVVSRDVLRIFASGLVTRMAASFALLVAVSSVLMRVAAWFPASAPLGMIQALALGALALGALGGLGATRITTFLTSLALARAGLVLFAFLGGVQGRGPLLLELAASGASLLLVAAAAERVDTLDDVSTLASVPRRLVLTLGAFSACSFPPFPGFVAAFPLSSAVLDGGYAISLLIACALLFLLALGSMRLVARAWEPGKPRTVETTVGLAALGLAIAATWAFSIAPARLIEIARAAALGIF